MTSSDFLIHPARLEGFGLVLAEALASGLPIVSSNVDGIPEVLQKTASEIVPPEDSSAFREASLRLLNLTVDDFNDIVQKGKNRAEDFRMHRRIDEMVKLFNDMLS
jgi:glycosyltransferase involved in cell wall biosynthesis